MMAPTMASVITQSQRRRLYSLYRDIHRASQQFASNNFRQYFERCARDDFRQFLSSSVLTDMPPPPTAGLSPAASQIESSCPPSLQFENFYGQMQRHLELLRRQAEINRLYCSPTITVRR